ncbi:hypothetical protein Tco_0576371, partial [Tanacetum coccineum]
MNENSMARLAEASATEAMAANANAMSAYMDDMISEVTYGIKKGLIFLGATTVEYKLQQR